MSARASAAQASECFPTSRVSESKELTGPHQAYQYLRRGGAGNRRESETESLVLCGRVMTEPSLRWWRRQTQVQKAEQPKQDEPKEAHTKTHHT